MIHLTEARKIICSGEPVDLVLHKLNGERVYANNVRCTSSYYKANTVKLQFLDSKEIRDFKAILITHINGTEVYL